jgi:hypothetical protein
MKSCSRGSARRDLRVSRGREERYVSVCACSHRSARCDGVIASWLPLFCPASFLSFFSLDCSRESPRAIFAFCGVLCWERKEVRDQKLVRVHSLL